MKIFLLTVGSQGDVQPFVALGLGLQAAGHQVTLATGRGFDALVSGSGLDYAPLTADFLEMAQSAEGKAAMAGKNLAAAMKKIMPQLRQILADAWQAGQGSDLIVYHPKALAGYSIAEKLGIPAYLSIPLPLYSPTRAFPVPILSSGDMGGALNRASYSLVDLASLPYRGVLKQFRQTIGLAPTANEKLLRGRPVPRLYPFSRHVVPPPADWDEHNHVTGYWFLPPNPGWRPPAALADFLAAGSAPVYVGFGSMSSQDGARLTGVVLDAVRQAGVRAVLASGWGGLSAADLPADVFMLESAPHDWLFPRTAAVAHHGGAGTTAAGLRAGKPSVICPLFGDQPFWGRRVQALGAGPKPLPLKKLEAGPLAAALRQAAGDSEMRRQAEALGEKIRAEDGVACAVDIITRGG